MVVKALLCVRGPNAIALAHLSPTGDLKCNQVRRIYGRSRIGQRTVVGHGCNGIATYQDSANFPFPAIRFMEDTQEIMALRILEKGDWRNLSCEEKKFLYRASFCQTFAEFQAPTGHWKMVVGIVLFITSFGFWMVVFYSKYVTDGRPKSLLEENQKLQLRRMIDLHVNPIDGISSKFDYFADDWL